MTDVRLDHFKRAISDIGAHGDNDTLPFDIDKRFVAENREKLAEMGLRFSQELEKGNRKSARNAIDGLSIFSERLLVPTGTAGFRITTKLHPFWNVYFNALGVAIAEKLEPIRSERAHSYRFVADGETLFDRKASWRAFCEASFADCDAQPDTAIIVQTDVSSFYEHIYHHRIENFVDDLFGAESTISAQVDRFLSKIASGRSFGLPVGGQCSRVLAELLMSAIDRRLAEAKVIWRRYVDDFVLIMPNQAEAYRGLAILANALADYGLTLNRTKTIFLTSRHYVEYVRTQLDGSDTEANKLSQIDLHFDHYSDTAESDYNELATIVQSLDIRSLLNSELRKAQPDTFLVTQIGRTLKLHDPAAALQLCNTLLSAGNLHAFRASWSTIMRGISAVCADNRFSVIFDRLDSLLDAIPVHSAHLVLAEASCLHYLRTLRFRRTQRRAEYVLKVYSATSSQTVRRACLDCWGTWRDRTSFVRERNQWNALKSEEQRMLWSIATEFGDEGRSFANRLSRAWITPGGSVSSAVTRRLSHLFTVIGQLMLNKRLPARDPRTSARDIPGLSDAIFPQLVQGFVANLNRGAIRLPNCEAVPQELVLASSLQRAMLFEVAVAVAEVLIASGEPVDWEVCLETAVERQRRHFDAKLPLQLTADDKYVAFRVAENLVTILRHLQAEAGGKLLVSSPEIPGHQWISSGAGDFALGTNLIEVKCTNKNFSSSDYRQIVMYWLLSYSAAAEIESHEWVVGTLVNPRLNLIVQFKFSDLVEVIGGGKFKVGLLELFCAMVERPVLLSNGLGTLI